MKAGLKSEILGGIAGEHQLGEGHDVGAEGAGPVHPIDDHPGIGFDGPHRGIDLGEGDPHPSHGADLTASPAL